MLSKKRTRESLAEAGSLINIPYQSKDEERDKKKVDLDLCTKIQKSAFELLSYIFSEWYALFFYFLR